MKFSKCIVVIVLAFLPGISQAQQQVNLRGTWELVSQKIDGKNFPYSGRQIKLLTSSHYAWVRQDKKQVEELLAKGTPHDSIMAYQDAYGAGTYKVSGDTYTETSEFFYAPQYIGTSIAFRFKLENGLWYISGHEWSFKNGRKVRGVLLEQVWKRID